MQYELKQINLVSLHFFIKTEDVSNLPYIVQQ